MVTQQQVMARAIKRSLLTVNRLQPLGLPQPRPSQPRPSNPQRFDPAGLGYHRQAFLKALGQRFGALQKAIQALVVADDAFGLVTNAQQYQFLTDAGKGAAFQSWLADQLDKGLLEKEEGDFGPGNGEPVPWTMQYVKPVYKKALLDDYAAIKGASNPADPFSEQAWMQQAFNAPVAVSSLALMAQRQYTGLKNITTSMEADLNRIMTNAVAQGMGVHQTAKLLKDNVAGFSKGRAVTFATTELQYVYAEGQLDGMDVLGVDEVSLAVEWLTAGDHKVCPQCQAKAGKTYSTKEARGIIPFHPRCRCCWLPAAPDLVGPALSKGKKFLKEHAAEKQAIQAAIDGKAAAKAAALAQKAAHAHKTKLGMAKKHYGTKYGVVPTDYTHAAPDKLGTPGLEKVLKGAKGWDIDTLKIKHYGDWAEVQAAPDVVAQKALIEALPKPTPAEVKIILTKHQLTTELGFLPDIDEGDLTFKGLGQVAQHLGLDVPPSPLDWPGGLALAVEPKAAGSLPEQLAALKAYKVEQDAAKLVLEQAAAKAAQAAAAKATAELAAKAAAFDAAIAAKAAKAAEDLAAAAKAKAPAGAPTLADLATWKKVRTLPGSTRPDLMQAPDGKLWVMKSTGSGIDPGHLRSEAMADDLYRRAGVAVPKSYLVETAEGPAKISEFIEGGQTLAEWQVGKSAAQVQAMYAQAHDGFVMDALLANHDVAGLSFDNMFVANGKLLRIDNGGALAYRAQGGAKQGWGPVVQELTSMRDPKVNGVTAKVFAGMTDTEINMQIQAIVDNKARILGGADETVKPVLEARIKWLEAKLPKGTGPAAPRGS